MKPVVVVDASVAVKWFIPVSPAEPDADHACELLLAYRDDLIDLLEPPIWQAEVAAVLARVMPDQVEQFVWRMLSFDHKVADSHKVYLKAAQLAVFLQHHMFDTLYHASALTHPSAFLVTADEKYRLKAEAQGRIFPLSDWRQVFDEN